MNAAYGTVAEFESPEQVLASAKRIREMGYRDLDAFTPFAVEGLAEAIGFERTRLPLVTLFCGILGGSLGYLMMWYTSVVSYPMNIGGRPFHSWPAFIPITFELTVLFAALGTAIGMLILNGLPRPHHPIFNTPHYAERSSSHFYLCVKSTDSLYDPRATSELLRSLGAKNVWEVERSRFCFAPRRGWVFFFWPSRPMSIITKFRKAFSRASHFTFPDPMHEELKCFSFFTSR
jgi:Alternative complex III, ActD subunit